jgi:anti-sigma regulatory factor (Ser/Thr protein kinase)
MAIDEALANVIRHAYHGSGDRRIELHCSASEGELESRIQDTGDPPGRSLICAGEVGCDKIGGLGTHIIRDVMDSLSCEARQEGNWFFAVKLFQGKA